MNDIVREGCVLLLLITLVPLLVTGFVGLMLSVLQASMQLQEQTISFLARIITCALVLCIMKSVLVQGTGNYMRRCLTFSIVGG